MNHCTVKHYTYTKGGFQMGTVTKEIKRFKGTASRSSIAGIGSDIGGKTRRDKRNRDKTKRRDRR